MTMLQTDGLSRVSVALALSMLALAACVAGPHANPGLDRAIKAHYEAYATEEDGICQSPRIDTIQSREATGTSDDGAEIVTVRYSYYDPHVDMDAKWDGLFHAGQPCGGFAERAFVLVRSDLGYRVADMTGERRKARRGN